MRLIKGWLVLSAAILGFAGGAQAADDKVVNVYNWSDYIDQPILDDFTKETGIKVVYDVYDINEILETKLLAGGSGYDIVVPTDFELRAPDQGRHVHAARQVEAAQPRQHVADHHAAHGRPTTRATSMPSTTCGAPIGLGYNVDKVKERLAATRRSTAGTLLFKPENAAKLADCGIYVLDAPDDVIQTRSNYLGLDPDSQGPGRHRQGRERCSRRSGPTSSKFHSSEYINALANGDICLALGYSGDVFQARDRAAEAEQRRRRSTTSSRRKARRCGSTAWRSRPTRRIPTRRTPSSTT